MEKEAKDKEVTDKKPEKKEEPKKEEEKKEEPKKEEAKKEEPKKRGSKSWPSDPTPVLTAGSDAAHEEILVPATCQGSLKGRPIGFADTNPQTRRSAATGSFGRPSGAAAPLEVILESILLMRLPVELAHLSSKNQPKSALLGSPRWPYPCTPRLDKFFSWWVNSSTCT